MWLGTMRAFAIADRHDSVWFQHDLVAYTVVAAVSCLSVVAPGAGCRLHWAAWLPATLGATWLVIPVAFGWRLIEIGGSDSWDWGRFRGLSENANQLALGCAVMGLLSLHLAAMAVRPGQRIAALVCMIGAIIIGRLTKSDCFLLHLIVRHPIVCFAIPLCLTAATNARRTSPIRVGSKTMCRSPPQTKTADHSYLAAFAG
jgi:hypothetical protein